MPARPQPPIWGPVYDERDLDALLSGAAYGLPGDAAYGLPGDAAYGLPGDAYGPPGAAHVFNGPGSFYGPGFNVRAIPEALRPVAASLAALRAAPAPGELAAEAQARALFRSFLPVSRAWAVAAQPGTVTSRALILPPAGRGRRRVAGRRRRRGARAVRWPVAVATGVAVLAVIVVAVALTGVLPDSITRIVDLGHPTRVSSSVTGRAQPSVTQRVDGRASRVRSGGPSPSAHPATAASGAVPATRGPAGLCREYYSFRAHPGAPGSLARAALWAKLSTQAGSPLKVLGYCLSASHPDGPPRGTKPRAVPTPANGSFPGGFGRTAGSPPMPPDAPPGSGGN
jgi:hypothetical protein